MAYRFPFPRQLVSVDKLRTRRQAIDKYSRPAFYLLCVLGLCSGKKHSLGGIMLLRTDKLIILL